MTTSGNHIDPVDDDPGVVQISSACNSDGSLVKFNNRDMTCPDARKAYYNLVKDIKKSTTWGNTYIRDDVDDSLRFKLYCSGCNHTIQMGNPSKFFKEHICNPSAKGTSISSDLTESCVSITEFQFNLYNTTQGRSAKPVSLGSSLT